ncbi:hypothetical protein RND71_015769 [Anisodus tanguticus]|uniref:Cytochrome oxidase subunit I profile domain-containing protein n=1 Tax=Anisodus tanguticus TaxID=243964 RepID=A0AAE1S6V0_9SOLA|nr:hypothetical protein RND71_015769 [Anisodus tanguticus]
MDRGGELFQRNLLGAALFLIIVLNLYSGKALDCLVAVCDAGKGSSSGPLDLSPTREPEPRLSEPEVAPIPRFVLVPELEQPLLTNIQRREELQQRLAFYFIGKNERRHLPLFLGILEKQVLLEKRVEAALVRDGFPAYIVLGLSGMPHRILDYPDAYAGWNALSSFGSYISVVGIYRFFVVVTITSSNGKNKRCAPNPWAVEQNPTTPEWIVQSPPAFHTFGKLPAIKETKSYVK